MILLGKIEVHQLVEIRSGIKVKCLKAIPLNICELCPGLQIFRSHFNLFILYVNMKKIYFIHCYPSQSYLEPQA